LAGIAIAKGHAFYLTNLIHVLIEDDYKIIKKRTQIKQITSSHTTYTHSQN